MARVTSGPIPRYGRPDDTQDGDQVPRARRSVLVGPSLPRPGRGGPRQMRPSLPSASGERLECANCIVRQVGPQSENGRRPRVADDQQVVTRVATMLTMVVAAK